MDHVTLLSVELVQKVQNCIFMFISGSIPYGHKLSVQLYQNQLDMLTVLGLMTVCILVGMQSRALLSHGKVLLEFGQAAECEKDPPVSVYVSLWVRCDYSVTDLCGICYLDEMITAMRCKFLRFCLIYIGWGGGGGVGWGGSN